MKLGTYKTFTLVAPGGTDNIVLSEGYEAYYLTSTTIILSSNYTLAASGTPVTGMNTKIYYRGDVTLGGNSITIFGATMPAEFADKQWTADLYYNGSAWEVNFKLDFEETGAINGDRIADGTIASAKLIELDGTKLTASTVPAGVIDETSMWAIRYAEITIPNASVLNSNTTPYQLLAAQAGVTYGIVWASILVSGHSAPYATNTTIQILSGIGAGTVEPICELDCLGTPAGTNPRFQLPFITPTTGATVYHLVQNQDIVFKTKTGDPTAGDGDLKITLAYIEIT